MRVNANSVLCLQCGKWIHGKSAGVKRVTPMFSRIFYAENVKGILERQWSRYKGCALKWKLSEFTYLGDRVSAVGGCEAAVTART